MFSYSYNSQIKCFWTYVDTDIFFSFCYVELVPKMCPQLSVTPCMCRSYFKVRDCVEARGMVHISEDILSA
jgi:hypothetical protein